MRYSRNLTTAVSLIAVSLLCVGIMIPPVFFIEPLPQWALLAYVVAMMALTILATIYVMKKLVNVPCTVHFGDKGFGFRLHGKPLLYRLRELSVSWKDISNISMNYDTQHDKSWIEVAFRNPSFSSSFWTGNMINSPDDGTERVIWNKLESFREAYNNTHARHEQIRDLGFYEKGWAKALTWFCWAAIGFAVIALILNPDADRVGRVVAMIAFCGMWIVNFYAARAKRKKEHSGSPQH